LLKQNIDQNKMVTFQSVVLCNDYKTSCRISEIQWAKQWRLKYAYLFVLLSDIETRDCFSVQGAVLM